MSFSPLPVVPLKSISRNDCRQRAEPAKVDRNWKCVAWAVTDLKESQVDWWRQGRRWLFNSVDHLFWCWCLARALRARALIRFGCVCVENSFRFSYKTVLRPIERHIQRRWIYFHLWSLPTHYMITRESFSAAECVVMFSPLLNFTSNGSWSVFAVEYSVELQKILKLSFYLFETRSSLLRRRLLPKDNWRNN